MLVEKNSLLDAVEVRRAIRAAFEMPLDFAALAGIQISVKIGLNVTSDGTAPQ